MLIVTNQDELDAALRADRAGIVVDADPAQPLRLSGPRPFGHIELVGHTRVAYLGGYVRVDAVFEEAAIACVGEHATIGSAFGYAAIGELRDDVVVDDLHGDAWVSAMSGRATIERAYGNAVVGTLSDDASIELLFGRAFIGKRSGRAHIGRPHLGAIMHPAAA